MQENHSRLPSTEHRAQVCSTKERGMRAASSSRAPASVMPWMTAALDSSRPPKR